MSTRKSRQPTPAEMVQKHAQQIRVEIAHWLNLRDYGCSDPFWPDGPLCGQSPPTAGTEPEG